MGIEAVPKTVDLIAKHELDEVQAAKLQEAVLLHYRLIPPRGLPIDPQNQQQTQNKIEQLTQEMSPAALAAFEEFLKGLLVFFEPRS